MAPSKPTYATAATAPYLELANVRFEGDGNFRVALTTPPNTIVCISIEEKRTKSQWTCAVTQLQDHTPAGADYVLPSTVVLRALGEYIFSWGPF
ncbi:Aste57867_10287 [Aphanomyces stellatus]|uniref:Aste57867_10287 protein n=1 Tax=Aphanomyces stellatus TaxID=120398 RepID=A0A485KQH4_9STRA|nr:hypothetical protein As57867_010247 [Aphanomyces stellatus]VFT87161.1 Aste57867_10287 [Aphanomyces stellatus]